MNTNTASRWIVLTVSCFMNANPFATVIAFGTLYVPLLEKFKEDRATTATLQSLLIGVTMCTGVIWGVLTRKFGLSNVMCVGSILVPLGYILSFFAVSLYQLIACIGIVAGIGTSIVHVCSSVAVAYAFDGKGAGIAIAIHSCNIGIGASAYPFLMDFLLPQYGINGLFLIIGGLNLNNIAVTLIIYYRHLDVKVKLENSQQPSDVALWKDNTIHDNSCIVRIIASIKNAISRMMNFHLVVSVVATGITVGCLNGFLVVILDLYTFKGFSSVEGLNSFTVLNACSIGGRLLPALLQFKTDVHPMTISLLCSVFGCAGLLVILRAREVTLMYVGNGLIGIAIGGLNSNSAVAALSFSSKDMFETAFGFMNTATGICAVVAGPFYGWMRDTLHSYDAVVGITTGFLGLGALLCLIAVCVPKTDPDKPTSSTVELEIISNNIQVKTIA